MGVTYSLFRGTSYCMNNPFTILLILYFSGTLPKVVVSSFKRHLDDTVLISRKCNLHSTHCIHIQTIPFWYPSFFTHTNLNSNSQKAKARITSNFQKRKKKRNSKQQSQSWNVLWLIYKFKVEQQNSNFGFIFNDAWTRYSSVYNTPGGKNGG